MNNVLWFGDSNFNFFTPSNSTHDVLINTSEYHRYTYYLQILYHITSTLYTLGCFLLLLLISFLIVTASRLTHQKLSRQLWCGPTLLLQHIVFSGKLIYFLYLLSSSLSTFAFCFFLSLLFKIAILIYFVA